MEKIRPREKVKSQWGNIIDFLGPFSGDINIFKGMEELTGADEATRRIHETDPERKIGPFEYAPFYSGLGDLNFRPEVTQETEEFYATGERKKPKEGYERGRPGYTNYPEVEEYQRQVLVKKELEKLQKEKDAEAAKLAKEKAEREAFLDSPKGRMQTMWNDADKRDAVLGGIADAMLETRVGVDAYGSRFGRAQKNVRENLKAAKATDIIEAKAEVDMMKTMAETEKLINPAQYFTKAQQNADSIVKAMIRDGQIEAQDYNQYFASTLQQITIKDLTSSKAQALGPMITWSKMLRSSDPALADILDAAIQQTTLYLAGGGTGEVGEVIDSKTITAKKPE